MPNDDDLDLTNISVTLEGVHVLLVGDSDESREKLELILSSHYVEVTLASSVEEALSAFAADSGALPEAIICDVELSDEIGYAVINRVRELPADQGGNTPAVMLTPYDRSRDRIRALASGFQMCLTKPIEPLKLLVVVKSLIGGI
jgi:CheY-like chemotaxis protein